MESLRAIVNEIEMSINEERKEAMEFQKDILEGDADKKSGRIDAARLVKFR